MTKKDIIYVTKACMPTMLIQIAVLFFLTYMPDLVLFMPKLFGYHQ